MKLLEEPAKVRAALSPLRRQLLELLQEPASGTQLAATLELPRQRVNYHLRELEKAGLVELVEERQRRGCVERILRATSGSFVVDPGVMGRSFSRIGDQYAAEHLVEVAAGTVRDVARMQSKADADGKRLLTFTLEAEVRFAEPGDVHRFTDALTEAVRQVVETFDTEGGRPYRLIAGGHPAPRSTGSGSTEAASPRGEKS
ncbi:helix-turn-helix domain-containing protein [Streptomyces sp. SID13031]|uniref:winged helix-turn-helix domain-containing protein n=1 Tax=Streptomyces sp. SID13031 TaxID=2706046 RepID=UPI0013C56B3C|nr:helix-turn-helix domain-containing protein [Streptomyces sp. SID13031]NEA31114.1 helix-turn-helix transcriptional regulator [Streptomyces sp. SID13031]